MASERYKNEDAINTLSIEIPNFVKAAKETWEVKSREFNDGWKHVPNKRKRDAGTLAILKENRRLTEALHSAKTHYDKWLKIKSIFEGELNP